MLTPGFTPAPQGRTTLQIINAPRGATFVWCTNNMAYVRALARHLGRTDLVLVGKAGLVTTLRSSRVPIVVDHALWLTTEERRMLADLNSKT